MKYLLDTHIFLWWMNNDKKLKNYLEEIISDPNNSIYVSIVSAWEISIKVRAKKLPLKTSFKKVFEKFQFNLLGIDLKHVLAIHKLPLHHKDPFDRMLVAQAIVEGLTVITIDPKIKKYRVKTIGV